MHGSTSGNGAGGTEQARLSRRRLIAGAARLGAGLGAGIGGSRALAALPPRGGIIQPGGVVRGNADGNGAGGAAGLPGRRLIRAWQDGLAAFGTRYTGSIGHAAFTDWAAAEMAAIPGLSVHADRLTFSRWLARDAALSVDVPAAIGMSGPVTLTSYYPYSGQTPAAGITGPLVSLGTYAPGRAYSPARFWAPARGAIALVRTRLPSYPLTQLQRPTGGFEPGASPAQAAADYAAYAGSFTHPALQGLFEPVPLLDARNAGVLGVICVWTGLPDDEVINQYSPFATPWPSAAGIPAAGDPGCPAVWVGDATGTRLAGLAASGQAAARLTLTADVTENAATHTVWGRLPGSGGSGQCVILNTHTDGPNAVEENGALGLLALARQLAAQPSRNFDVYLAMVAGHFQLPQFTVPVASPVNVNLGNSATSTWMAAHPDIMQGAVLGLTVEHLGATAWAAGGDGTYAATGGGEWCATYAVRRAGAAPASPAPASTEEDGYLAAVAAVNAAGLRCSPVATVVPGPVPRYIGEGSALYTAGLGTLSLCPLPTYLLQAGDARRPRLLNLDKVDHDLMYGQISALARAYARYDATEAGQL